jgi:hypothetical protein
MSCAAASDPKTCTMRTREFKTAPWRSIAVTVLVVSALLTGLLALGLPPLLGPFVLIAAIVVLLRRATGESTWTIGEDGLTRSWRSLAARASSPPAEELRIPWSALRAWRHDHTRTRSTARVEYLELDTAEPRRFVITDRQDAAGFAALRDAFLARMARTVAPSTAADTPLAHLATLAAFACTLGLFVALLFGLLSPTNVFRLCFVIVPGTAYLFWRTWLVRR